MSRTLERFRYQAGEKEIPRTTGAYEWFGERTPRFFAIGKRIELNFYPDDLNYEVNDFSGGGEGVWWMSFGIRIGEVTVPKDVRQCLGLKRREVFTVNVSRTRTPNRITGGQDDYTGLSIATFNRNKRDTELGLVLCALQFAVHYGSKNCELVMPGAPNAPFYEPEFDPNAPWLDFATHLISLAETRDLHMAIEEE